MPISSRPTLNVELTPRGETPLTPDFAPLPQYMKRTPFGLDENGRHIKDLRGNVIKPAILYLLEYVESQAGQTPERATRVKQTRDQVLAQLIERLNAHIPNPLYHVTPEYL